MNKPSVNLAVSHPVLAAQWHPTLNGAKSPETVSAGSDFRAFWVCESTGHTWQSPVSNRVRGRGCPYCAGKAVLAGFNDLATTHPLLASEWHQTLNGGLTPENVNAGSHKEALWTCSKSKHEWKATIASRAKAGNGCPVCAGKVAQTGLTDLATLFPEIAAEWHPTQNESLKPSDVLPKSNLSVVWCCSKCGHNWTASPATRSRSGCPACAGKVVVVGFNDLATTNPELTAEWHPTLNATITPQTVSRGSGYVATWACREKGHLWEASISNRAGKGYGCPVCSNVLLLTGFNDLETTNPELAAQWHPTLNGERFPKDVVAGSDEKVFWLCDVCGHTWKARLAGRSRKRSGCPVCAGQAIREGFNDLATTNPELASEWHPTLNGELTPQKVTAGTHRKVFWLCSAFGHIYESSLVHRSRGQGCPFCSGRQVLAGFNDLATTNPELADQWHPTLNGQLTPEMVTSGSSQNIWWSCDSHQHEWRAFVSSRSRGTGCPICAGQVVLVGFNDLSTTHPQIASEWHPTLNGENNPSTVSGGSGLRAWWLCPEKQHEYRSQVNARTYMGTGCPTCAQYGFDASKPGILYFIVHQRLAARKIGITNVGKRRLASFAKSGWVQLLLEEREQGLAVRDVETAVLSWLRKEHALPQYLGKEEMGKEGGWTETFSEEGPTNVEVIERIKLEFCKIDQRNRTS